MKNKSMATIALAIILLAIPFTFTDQVEASDTIYNGQTWYVKEAGEAPSTPAADEHGTLDNPVELTTNLWDTIQNGDTIYLVGTFENAVSVLKNVQIIGTEGSVQKKGVVADMYYWKGGERGTITLKDLDVTTPLSVEGTDVWYVENHGLNSFIFEECTFSLSGVTDENDFPTGMTNIYVYTVDSLVFRNCDFNGAYNGSNQWITAIQVINQSTNVNSIEISDCSFNGHLRGCDLHLAKKIVVENSTFVMRDNHPTTDIYAIQLQQDLSGTDITIKGNDFVCESAGGAFLAIHSNSSFTDGQAPGINLTENSIVGFETGIVYRQSSTGVYCPVPILAENNYFSTNGSTGIPIPAVDETDTPISGLVKNDVYYLDETMTSTNIDQSQDVPPSYDDDDLPPFIPAQPKDSGDDVTIVACAAAAVVAALMAVFLIVSYKKD